MSLELVFDRDGSLECCSLLSLSSFDRDGSSDFCPLLSLSSFDRDGSLDFCPLLSLSSFDRDGSLDFCPLLSLSSLLVVLLSIEFFLDCPSLLCRLDLTGVIERSFVLLPGRESRLFSDELSLFDALFSSLLLLPCTSSLVSFSFSVAYFETR